MRAKPLMLSTLGGREEEWEGELKGRREEEGN